MALRWAATSAVLLLFVTCTPSTGGVSVELDEYTLEVGTSSTEAGRATFDARNVGKIEHELVALRTRLDADELPVKDGEVQTQARGVTVAGKTGRIKAGRAATLGVTLDPGSYVLICNVPAHYQSGMRAPLRVS